MDLRKSTARREERNQLLQFLEAQKILQFFDCPDLIIDLGGEKIGIEHTRILRDRTPVNNGSHERQRESIESQIVKKAKEFYVAKKHYDLNVCVFFNPTIIISQKQVSTIAQQLCDYIRAEEPHDISSGHSQHFTKDVNPLLNNKLPESIAHCWIEAAVHNDDLWSPSIAGFFGSLKSNLIQFSLDDKETKIPDYRSKCDKVWILVVAVGGQMSSAFDFTNSQFLEVEYISSADAVYLLDSFLGTIYELRIKPRKP